MLDALDRDGFDVGVGPEFESSMTRGRSFFRSDATSEIHLAIGPKGDRRSGGPSRRRVEIAYDRQTPKEQAEYRRLRRKATAELRAAGLPDLVPVVDDSLFMASIQTQIPDAARKTLEQMLAVGQPAAIFVEPTAGT